MTAALEDLGKHIEAELGSKVIRRSITLGELTIVVPADAIVSVLTMLRDDKECRFEQLIDICGVDYPERERRFDVVYHAVPRKTSASRQCEETPTPGFTCPASSSGFPLATWYAQREAYDRCGNLLGPTRTPRSISTIRLPGAPVAKGIPSPASRGVGYGDAQTGWSTSP